MGPNRVGVSFPSPEDKNYPVSETLCFLIRNPDDGKVQKSSDSE
jgi:hypothetical protein